MVVGVLELQEASHMRLASPLRFRVAGRCVWREANAASAPAMHGGRRLGASGGIAHPPRVSPPLRVSGCAWPPGTSRRRRSKVVLGAWRQRLWVWREKGATALRHMADRVRGYRRLR